MYRISHMAQLWRGALEAGGFMAPTRRYTVETLKITKRKRLVFFVLYNFDWLNLTWHFARIGCINAYQL